MVNVCVYCSSSADLDPAYVEAAVETGRLLAGRSFRLVYGGGKVGLMGMLARAVHEHGGHVTGIIPDALKNVEGVAYDTADEIIVTESMQERKAEMYGRADSFIVLPGGFGTLEEFMEVLTLKRLGYHEKPIVVVNVEGFFDPLFTLFEHFYEEGMARSVTPEPYYVSPDADEAVAYLSSNVAV